MSRLPEKKHPVLALALDVLIGDPQILTPDPDPANRKADTFLIPESYVSDQLSKFQNDMTSRGDAARELRNVIDDMMLYRQDDPLTAVPLANGTRVFFVRTDANAMRKAKLDPNEPNHQVIMAALDAVGPHGDKKDIAVMTGAGYVPSLVSMHGVNVARRGSIPYTGRRKVFLPMEQATRWFSNQKFTAKEWANLFPQESPLLPHEFVEFLFADHILGEKKLASFAHIGRFDPSREALVPLQYLGNSPFGVWPKTAGQAMLMEALLAPPSVIPCVVNKGIFGAGKTFIELASGLWLVVEGDSFGNPIYDRIFVCPREVSLGKELGALPGGVTEKVRPTMRSLDDNLRNLLKIAGTKRFLPREDSGSARPGRQDDNQPRPGGKGKGSQRQRAGDNAKPRPVSKSNDARDLTKAVEHIFGHYIEVEATRHMLGRSLSNCFVIYDEFQEADRRETKALLSRIGNDSKVVVSGDPKQLSNPYLSSLNNGLAYSASKLASSEYAAVVTFNDDESVRSEFVRDLATRF